MVLSFCFFKIITLTLVLQQHRDKEANLGKWLWKKSICCDYYNQMKSVEYSSYIVRELDVITNNATCDCLYYLKTHRGCCGFMDVCSKVCQCRQSQQHQVVGGAVSSSPLHATARTIAIETDQMLGSLNWSLVSAVGRRTADSQESLLQTLMNGNWMEAPHSSLTSSTQFSIRNT